MNIFKYLSVLVVSSCAAAPVTAQERQCAPYNEVKENLMVKYGETVQSIGLTARNNLFVMMANTETGSWTALNVDPTLMACLISAGDSYSNHHESPKSGEQL